MAETSRSSSGWVRKEVTSFSVSVAGDVLEAAERAVDDVDVRFGWRAAER